MPAAQPEAAEPPRRRDRCRAGLRRDGDAEAGPEHRPASRGCAARGGLPPGRLPGVCAGPLHAARGIGRCGPPGDPARLPPGHVRWLARGHAGPRGGHRHRSGHAGPERPLDRRPGLRPAQHAAVLRLRQAHQELRGARHHRRRRLEESLHLARRRGVGRGVVGRFGVGGGRAHRGCAPGCSGGEPRDQAPCARSPCEARQAAAARRGHGRVCAPGPHPPRWPEASAAARARGRELVLQGEDGEGPWRGGAGAGLARERDHPRVGAALEGPPGGRRHPADVASASDHRCSGGVRRHTEQAGRRRGAFPWPAGPRAQPRVRGPPARGVLRRPADARALRREH
mmetsp:Transcript_47042/g.147421  ORF Transcript_47042/g.147421 Transcript_47042/m.147421 type:complete len:341 (+) Transcript_47042:506-1528(+)